MTTNAEAATARKPESFGDVVMCCSILPTLKWIDHHGATANLPWSGRCTYTDVQEVSRDVVLSSHSIGNLIQTGSHHDIKMRHATLLRPLLELSLWKERQNLYHRRKPQVKASNETSSTHYSSAAVWGGCFVLLCWPAALVVKQGMVPRNLKWNEPNTEVGPCWTVWLRQDHFP